MQLSAIVPCFDEEGNLRELVERMASVFASPAIAGDAELILIDDGSADATFALATELASRHAFVVALRHATNLGIPAAWRTGAAVARGRLVCVLDADMQYQPEDVLRLLDERARSGAAIVQGWRSPIERERGARFWISRGLNLILNACFAMNLRDNKSGFFLCSREVLVDLMSYRQSYRYWQEFVMVAAHAKGYSIGQIEARFHPRRAGKSAWSDVPLVTIAHVLVDVGRALAEYR